MFPKLDSPGVGEKLLPPSVVEAVVKGDTAQTHSAQDTAHGTHHLFLHRIRAPH
jgi:hypothetical protein